MELLERIVDKLFSGSFSMLVMIGWTYCVIMIGSLYMAIKGKLPVDTFLGMVAGLSGVFMALWKDYLTKPTNGGNGNVKTDSKVDVVSNGK